jgi:hypothetical protein
MRDDQEAPENDPKDLEEDHREGPPGYDLDEQAAIERLAREREGEAGDDEG